jgi:hypothetical protein
MASLLALALLGCGGRTASDGGSDATGGAGPGSLGPLASDEQIAALGEDFCGAQVECFGLYRDASECARSQEYSAAELLAALERGSVVYDPEALRACRAQFASAPCQPGRSPAPARTFPTASSSPEREARSLGQQQRSSGRSFS